MSQYNAAIDTNNLRRAYRWLQSNPDALYKNYFRSSYEAYAASSATNLTRLRKHLLRRDYQPGHASKVFLPKPSGILRPITLLSVNDQIVYQACVNIIAERLQPRLKRRPKSTVFGHSYAGKSSAFFYHRWQNQYKRYCQAVMTNIKSGHEWVANFDLSAFYDSIDHHTLRNFLLELGLDDEFNELLFQCLRTWTSSTWPTNTDAIYIEHGIPQGPQASGLLSEVILQHLDRAGLRGRRTKYVRYVDDIKIFARSEEPLRQKLVGLDLAAKEVGLFPQSSKINIRKVQSPESEIKSVSIPPEPVVREPSESPAIRSRILQILRSRPIKDREATLLKFLLSNTKPHHRINQKLIRLVEQQPEFAPNVAQYLSQYKRLPRRTAENLSASLRREWIYHAPQASLFNAAMENMPEPQRSECLRFCYDRITGRVRPHLRPQPTLKFAMAAWCIFHAKLTFSELQEFFWSEPDWWVRQSVIPYIESGHFGRPTLSNFLTSVAKDTHADVARSGAAYLMDVDPESIRFNHNDHESARLVFFEGGYLRALGRPRSLVDKAVCALAHCDPTQIRWERILGGEHRASEEMALRAKKLFESNDHDGAVVQFDSLFDMIFRQLFTIRCPRANYPAYGNALQHPHLMAWAPCVCAAFSAVHQLRIRSPMAHPYDIRRGRLNRRLKHRDVRHLGPLLRNATQELVTLGY